MLHHNRDQAGSLLVIQGLYKVRQGRQECQSRGGDCVLIFMLCVCWAAVAVHGSGGMAVQ